MFYFKISGRKQKAATFFFWMNVCHLKQCHSPSQLASPFPLITIFASITSCSFLPLHWSRYLLPPSPPPMRMEHGRNVVEKRILPMINKFWINADEHEMMSQATLHQTNITELIAWCYLVHTGLPLPIYDKLVRPFPGGQGQRLCKRAFLTTSMNEGMK